MNIEPANYLSWIRKDYWRLDEAVSLMLGMEPGQQLDKYRDQQRYDEYKEMLETTLRCEAESLEVLAGTHSHPMFEVFDTDYAQVKPTTFVQWANTKGYCVPDELSQLLHSNEPESGVQPGGSTKKTTGVVENRMSPVALSGDLTVVVDDVNQNIVVVARNGKQTKYARSEILGKGAVTWDLLVAFARCRGSLEGNATADVKKLNTSVNRKNLGKKLMDGIGLDDSPIIQGRNGVMRFQSIDIAGSASSPDALGRKTISTDDQATEWLRSRGDDMPLGD